MRFLFSRSTGETWKVFSGLILTEAKSPIYTSYQWSVGNVTYGWHRRQPNESCNNGSLFSKCLPGVRIRRWRSGQVLFLRMENCPRGRMKHKFRSFLMTLICQKETGILPHYFFLEIIWKDRFSGSIPDWWYLTSRRKRTSELNISTESSSSSPRTC